MLVQDFLQESARRFPQKTALVCEGERWTYAQIEMMANRLANGFLKYGLKRGERTAGKGLHRARHDAATRCSVGAAGTIRAFSGIASAYTGDRQSAKDMTAAHCTLPFGTRVEVTNVVSGRTVVVTITDRGPFVRGRVLDLSPAAARAIGLTKGVVRIKALVM